MICFGPESLFLITGQAEERRNFLDWSVFHVEHATLDVWRRWRRALRQRNALLRTNASDAEFESWEHDLAGLAEEIHQMRGACLTSLQPYLQEEADRLVPELGFVCFDYKPGWDDALGLAWHLSHQRARDRERGFTQRGPHRADWSLRFDRVAQREHLSRGQAKAVALACALAQTRWLRERLGEYPLLCLDDLGSELDASHVVKVMAWLRDTPLQAWLTSTSHPTASQRGDGTCVFHVEHAGLTRA